MPNKMLAFIFTFVIVQLSFAQDGLRFTSNEAMIGYTLFESVSDAVLVDNCGKLINRWNNVRPRYHAKLLPNGNLVYLDNFSGNIIEKDWDNNMVVNIADNDSNIYLDYEVIVLPNGNYLCLGREVMTQDQFIELGFNFGVIGFPNRSDIIVEFDKDTGEIVWKWSIIDHVIQERDQFAGNFGSLSDNPQLLNMDAIRTFDWLEEFIMINGFDYNPELDQIAISLRKLGEVAIIDHSTTTEEAAGSTGGDQGKGGDILYRWGNPENYDRGEPEDRELYFQHNPNWVEHGPYEGHLIMYDNGLNRPNVSFDERYSAAKIIDTQVSATGSYDLPANDVYPPANGPTMEYSRVTTGTEFYSGYTSSAKVLPTNNILITVGGPERIIEINPAGEIVWEYGIPFPSNFVFRSEKYIREYPAFDGKDLTPGGAIVPSSVSCLSSVSEMDWEVQVDIFLDSSKGLNIKPASDVNYTFSLLNVSGQKMLTSQYSGHQHIDLSTLDIGFYFVHLTDEEGRMRIQKIVINK